METFDTTKFMDASKFDWGTYYKNGEASLRAKLESKPEMWEKWTNSDKRYMLVTDISLIENDFNKTSGTVTAHFDAHISSNSIESLRGAWQNFFSKRPYDTTKQHFIADIKERKIVEFVSVCM